MLPVRSGFLIYSATAILVFVSLTFFRQLSLVLLPAFYVFLFLYISLYEKECFGLSKYALFLFFIIGVGVARWIFFGSYFYNFILSVAFIFSFYFVFAVREVVEYGYSVKLIKVVVFLMLMHSVVGFLQYAYYRYDDAFIGFYGRSGLQSHGLAMIYAFLTGFLFSERHIFGKNLSLFLSFFFLLSFVFCFYGSGLVYFILSLSVALLVSARFFQVVASVVIVSILLVIVDFFNPAVTRYNLNILGMFYDNVLLLLSGEEFSDAPRRLVFLVSYFDMVRQDVLSFFLGIGPGTYNSRTAFLLNGDYSSFSSLPVSIHPYAEKYVFPLWNSDILSLPYSDGSMNQPFSSVFSILAEYGFLFFVVYFGVIFKKYFEVKSLMKKGLWYFLGFFLFMLVFFENIIEYPEIVFVFFVIMQYFRAKKVALGLTWR